jgi:hypothetical protein
LWGDNIVDFQDHLNDLGSQLQLLFLRVNRLEDTLLVHVVGSEGHGVNSDEWVLLFDLHFLDVTYIGDWVESGVLSESHWDLLESVGESADGILFNSIDLISLLGNLDGASELSGTTSSNYVVILDHVSDDADGIEEASLGLVTNRAGSTSDQHGDGLGVLAFLNEENLIVRGTERELLDNSSLSELLWGNLFESWDDSSSGGDSQELDLDSSNPSDSWKFIMHEKMVGLVIETPLAEHDVGSGVLALLNHVHEVLLLHIIQLLVVCGTLNLKTMLRLWLWWFEWASQDQYLGVLNFLVHLWVREVLVQNDSLDELGIFKSSSCLGHDLDEVKVDVLSLKVGDMQNGLESQVGVVSLALRDNLGSKSGHCALSKILMVVLGNIYLLLNLVQLLHCNLAGGLKAVSDLQWVDTLIEKLLGLLEDGASEDHNSGSSISDLIVLGCGKLYQKSGGLMMDLHLLEDGGTIVGDDDLSVWRNQHLVHTLWTEGSLKEGSNSSGGQDVNLSNILKIVGCLTL